MNFRKSSEGGGGSFSIQKFMLQIFAIIDDTSVMNFRKKLQHNFPTMRGGGQRPFETFPKIHPFWKGKASLRLSKKRHYLSFYVALDTYTNKQVYI